MTPDRENELRRVQESIWVLQAQGGDEQSFQMLVGAYDRRLLYFVRRFERDADKALDVVQDVWLTVFRKLGGLRTPEAFRTWAYRIAHTKVVATIRRETREAKAMASLQTTATEKVDCPQQALDDAQVVLVALARISPPHREILVLRFLENMSLEEIAEVLGRRLGTVKSRIHYAKQSFRQAVEELDND